LGAKLIRISFSSPSGGEVGVGLMWEAPKHQSTMKHGLSTEQFPVSANVGNSKNLKDLNALEGFLGP
jgi:hypothetical protein